MFTCAFMKYTYFDVGLTNTIQFHTISGEIKISYHFNNISKTIQVIMKLYN